MLFFGVLRDTFGGSERWVDLAPEPCSVGTLLRLLLADSPPAAQALAPSFAIAVNRHYARAADLLHEGDEVALLPPVSGGAPPAQDPSRQPASAAVLLTASPLHAETAVQALKAGSDGAVVVFDGIVRNNTRGRETEYLLYEAYESMALEQMRGLVAEARTRFAVREALLHHRLGRLEIGETSVLIAVASAHRGAAFDACRWIIDTLKKTVPIWKKEFFVDGAVWADGEPFPEQLRPDGSEARA